MAFNLLITSAAPSAGKTQVGCALAFAFRARGMRVGLVVYGGLHLVSGGFRYDRMLARELRALGDDVDEVVDQAGLSKKVARMRPLGVIKG